MILVFVFGVLFGAILAFCVFSLLSIADDDNDGYRGPQE